MTQVAVFGGNHRTDGNPPEFPISADCFVNTAAPVASEDGPSGLVALSAVLSGNSLAISWPQSAGGFNLEATDDLAAPPGSIG